MTPGERALDLLRDLVEAVAEYERDQDRSLDDLGVQAVEDWEPKAKAILAEVEAAARCVVAVRDGYYVAIVPAGELTQPAPGELRRGGRGKKAQPPRSVTVSQLMDTSGRPVCSPKRARREARRG